MVVVCEYDDECIAAMERLVVEQLCASTVVSSIATNCSRHDLFGSRTAQLRARRSSYVAQPSAVQLRWTQRCVRGAGASSGCYVDVAWASTGAVSDTDKLPPNARMVRTDQHAHGRDSTHCGVWTLTMTPEHQSVGASGSAD
jgi:hypothetical protein